MAKTYVTYVGVVCAGPDYNKFRLHFVSCFTHQVGVLCSTWNVNTLCIRVLSTLFLPTKILKSLDIRNKSLDFLLKKCEYFPLKNVKFLNTFALLRGRYSGVARSCLPPLYPLVLLCLCPLPVRYLVGLAASPPALVVSFFLLKKQGGLRRPAFPLNVGLKL